MDVGKVSRRKVQLQNLQNAQVIEKSKGMSDADKSIFDKLEEIFDKKKEKKIY